MSCQFKAYAKVDVEELKNTLISSSVSGGSSEAYDDSSGSKLSASHSAELSFLNTSCVSLSPSGEFLVFGQQKTLSILSAKWDSHEEEEVKTKFKTTWTGNPCHNDREEITAVLVLPLIMPNKSSRTTHTTEQTDWTCIVVGYNTGHLRFYDEGGDLLLSEQIHDEPVRYIKCQSYHPSKNSSYDDYAEELYVTFCSSVAIIPGFALFQTLRACRNHLARVKANFSEHISPPPLTLKKWAFVDHESVSDCEVIGPSSSDMFDHLMTASMCGGFNTCYRSGAPKSTVVVAAGKGPFIGFHHALEGIEGRSVLTDVAQVVKSKFKGFFGGSSKDSQKSTAVIEPPENLACRFSLFDPNREADHIVRSPNREYSVVSDGLGRLTLINNLRGIAVRMWKGYRRAQCGWLQVEEEEPSQKGNPKHLLRTVLFLVIYDPKKGMLEVWTVPNGVRVAAFSCSKKGRLLYTSHGLVGLNNAAVKWANKSLLPCAFIDPNGTVFQIIVPFHCALSDSTSDRAADLALLRKLKSILRENDLDDEQLAQEVGLSAAELKTEEVRKQMLTMLTLHKHITIDALEAALAVFTDRAMSEDSKRQMLLLSCQQLRNLLGFYKFVQQQKDRPPNYASVVPQEGISDLQAACDVLSVSERELTALRSLMSLLGVAPSSQNTPRREARVTFHEGTSPGTSLVDYLACFEIGKTSQGNIAPNTVAIKKMQSSKLKILAELLFQGILYSDVPVEVWQAEAACSGILPFNLLDLAINFWLSRNAGKALEIEMIRFSEIVKAICLLEEVNSYDLSSFWSPVRGILASSAQPFNALTAALVCRAVACSMEKRGFKKSSKSPKKNQAISKTKDLEESCSSNSNGSDMPKESNSVTSEDLVNAEARKSSAEWEDVSWDSVKWNLLIGRLEDIALLDQVLSQNPADLCDLSMKNHLPCLPYVKPTISLSTVLEKGKGAISEHVAKWITTCGADPKTLIESSDIEWTEKDAGVFNNPEPMDVDEPGPEDKSEVMIREGIPVMPERGMEASSLSTSHAQILDKIHMLRLHFPYSLCGSVLVSNITWEYLLEWHKAPEYIDILNAAITCLQIVPNIHIRQGLCSLMWSSHLKQRFETATRIVNESNGNPKEKLCRRELQMSDGQLVEFVETCIKFIELYIEAINLSEVMNHPGPKAVVNRSEDIWDYDELVLGTSTPSLTCLALTQQQTSFEHLHLLHQLAVSMHMILALNLRGQQLTPIFKPTEWAEFFSESSGVASVQHEYVDPQLSKKRTQFLIRAVSGAMQSVISSDPSHVTDLSGGLSADMSTAMLWFGKCSSLAYTWDISIDPIRRHHVCLLYSSGHDRLAEEILPAVNDLGELASQLLMICGQRLRVSFKHSTDLMEKISNLDPYLTDWLHDLNTIDVREVPLSDTALLATHVVQHLPENHPEYDLAADLFDALQALQCM